MYSQESLNQEEDVLKIAAVLYSEYILKLIKLLKDGLSIITCH